MTLLQPLIGIPCRHVISSGFNNTRVNAQNPSYLSAVSQAGGIPFLIPLGLETPALRQLYDMAAGILLTGGGDIEPAWYRQIPQADLADVQTDRDQLEITLSRWAAAEGKPALGICRGIQVMAVAGGGQLCQDLPTFMPEATLHHYIYQAKGSHSEDYLAHRVDLNPTCRLAQFLQTTSLEVNSLHHQAIVDLPEPLQIVGYSNDGVVEAIERPDHPFYCGVQWHPEVLVHKQGEARQIFAAFIKACTVWSSSPGQAAQPGGNGEQSRNYPDLVFQSLDPKP